MTGYILNDDRDAKDILIELRESTGMNRHQFCEYFEQLGDVLRKLLKERRNLVKVLE